MRDREYSRRLLAGSLPAYSVGRTTLMGGNAEVSELVRVWLDRGDGSGRRDELRFALPQFDTSSSDQLAICADPARLTTCLHNGSILKPRTIIRRSILPHKMAWGAVIAIS